MLIERSPILGAMLADGLRRGMEDEVVGKIIRDRLSLFVADTREVLVRFSKQPSTIYLDPMYPKREASALNKKEMRILRELVGDDVDGPSLLESALEHAANRVVVKRPKGAPMLAGHRPSHQIFMKNSRFDVYMVS